MTQATAQQTERRSSGKQVKKDLLRQLIGREVIIIHDQSNTLSGKLTYQPNASSPGFYVGSIHIQAGDITSIEVESGTMRMPNSYAFQRTKPIIRRTTGYF